MARRKTVRIRVFPEFEEFLKAEQRSRGKFNVFSPEICQDLLHEIKKSRMKNRVKLK